jgi:geranylgeranyl pyrophosphate synthase
MNNYFINIEKYIITKYITKYPNELKDKILYLLQNGKRLRPILFLIYSDCENIEIINTTVNDTVNTVIHDTLYTIAICIELIHSLSLVLDDLPEMDNYTIRRDNY